MPKLNQIIAIEKGIKSRVTSEFTELHKSSQHADLFNGFAKTYRKKDEAGENFPSETLKVRLDAKDVMQRASQILTELFDVTAAKDWANTEAKADVMVGGQALITQVPVPYLLFLEKQLTDLHTFIDKMPVLDETYRWEQDPTTGQFRTEIISTHRTQKVAEPIVLYPATPEHPAQTQLIQKDVTIGWWDTERQSAAMPKITKDQILQRLEELRTAVKFAREEANGADAPQKAIGTVLFNHLFG